jgi:DNA end-binding protein Ku
MINPAEQILATKAGKFDPSRFKDEYEAALKALVKRKAAGKSIEPAAPPARAGNVIDLMDALKRSLKSGRKAPAEKKDRPRPAKRRRRRAA